MATYRKSIYDNLSDALSPVMRKIKDINVDLMGTKTAVLRITKEGKDDDLMGDFTETWTATIVDNVVLRYPLNEVRLYGELSGQQVDTNAVFLEEILPITMYIKWEGDFTEDPIEMVEGDIIVDCLFDDTGDKIPIIMTVETIIGSFFGKNLVGKRFELSLYRGQLETDAQTEVDNYINNL